MKLKNAILIVIKHYRQRMIVGARNAQIIMNYFTQDIQEKIKSFTIAD